MVPWYRRESVTTGEDPGREGDPWRRKCRGGGSKVPAMCSSTVQADLTCGKREREHLPRTKRYEQGGQRRGHDISNADSTGRATQERVQFQRVGPPAQLLHRYPETSDRVMTMEGGSPTVQIAKREASRSAG